MSTNLKILHIAETVKGGIASYLDQVVPELNTRPVAGRFPDQFLFLPAGSDVYLPSIPRERIGFFKPVRRRSPIDLFRLGTAMRGHIADAKPDLIFLHSTFAGALVRAFPTIRGLAAKTVYCAHGPAYDAPRNKWVNRAIEWFERTLAQRTDMVVALSDREVARCIQIGFPADRVMRVYNGIAPHPPHADPARWNDPRLKVLFIGRFDRQKGIDTLMTAAAFGQDKLSVRCAGEAVVGRGGLKHLPSNVEFLGWLDPAQLQAQLLAADVVAMPSRWEGMGIAAIEAMRAGKPLVASAVGGLQELVVDGKTGWHIPPDSPALLLGALLRPNGGERRAAGMAGQERFRQMFTVQHCVDGLQDVLECVCASPPVQANGQGI
jgi:glycosyltransferase involved in cell wall biosynthesis